MKELIAGVMRVMIGVGIGMAVGVSAAHATFFHFYTNAEINKQPDLFAMGYVAGASDMLQTAIINDVNGGTYTAWLQKQVNCLFTKENTLGDLEVWAKYRWTINSRTFPDNIGASTLLIDACL